jgi:hypothetical protein
LKINVVNDMTDLEIIIRFLRQAPAADLDMCFLYKKDYDWCLLQLSSRLCVLLEDDSTNITVLHEGLWKVKKFSIQDVMHAVSTENVGRGNSLDQLIRVVYMAYVKTSPCGIAEAGLSLKQAEALLRSLSGDRRKIADDVYVFSTGNDKAVVGYNPTTNLWELDVYIGGKGVTLDLADKNGGERLLNRLV